MILLTRHIIFIFILSANLYASSQRFVFYKAFPVCHDICSSQDIYAYTQKEADEKFKNKTLKANNLVCKKSKYLFEKDDEEYKVDAEILLNQNIKDNYLNHFYSLCFQKKLHLKHIDSKICTTNYKWPFHKVSLINDNMLTINLDGFYFIFKKKSSVSESISVNIDNSSENQKTNSNNKINFIVKYIDKNFEFGQEKNRKEFFKNQKLWEEVSKNDCRLIYSDIGSRESFNIYYKSCIDMKNENRFTFLLNNYICKVSQISSEPCIEKQKFNNTLKAYYKFLSKKNAKISLKTLTPYNNIAYYLQKAGANQEAIYLLEKIIAKFPNRTVAYYNLGDAYWARGEKKKAIKAYTTYIEQMCHKGLQKKIPKKVLKRVKDERTATLNQKEKYFKKITKK